MPVTAGSSVHSFRFEAIYDCGVSHLLSISREFDLMASWNRFVLNPCVLQEPTLCSSLLVSRCPCVARASKPMTTYRIRHRRASC